MVEKQPKPEKIKVTQDEYELYGMNQRGPTIASRHFITVSEAKRPTLLTRKQRVGQIIRVTARVAVLVGGLSLTGAGVADVSWSFRIGVELKGLNYLSSIIGTIDQKIDTQEKELKMTRHPENIARLQKELDILIYDRQALMEDQKAELERVQPRNDESLGRFLAGLLMSATGLLILFTKKVLKLFKPF